MPPLTYIPRETMAAYRAWVRKAARTATEDDVNLKLLELVLDEQTYGQVAALPPAVVQQISDRIAEESEAKLGESGASTSS